MRGSSDRARLPRLLSSNSGRGVSRSGGRLRLTTVGAACAPPVFCTNGLLPCFRRRGGRAAYSLSTEFVRRAALALIPEVRAEISPHLREPRSTRRLRLPRHDDRPHCSGFRPQATRDGTGNERRSRVRRACWVTEPRWSGRGAPQHLNDKERELEGLLRVQPWVAYGVVP